MKRCLLTTLICSQAIVSSLKSHFQLDYLFTANQILDRNGGCHFKSRKEEVEQLIKAVVGGMLTVCKLNLPSTKFNKHMKPYWRYNKDTLNETHAMK